MADREEAKARQAEAAQRAQQIVIEATATAQQQQIDATTAALQAQAQAAAAQAESASAIAAVEQQTAQLEVLAKAARPPYGLIGLAFVSVVLVAFMGFKAVLAAKVGQSVEEVRLLPGSAAFEQAMLASYGGDWYRRREAGQVRYYLRDGSEVKALVRQ
jgi:hypothetical protein